ncbi:MAG: hypothetical protein EPN55_05835 [Gammaproteobacteria bacterium]|nr:MAG: hypothetical protein EPN55_05835 [Gammaproteobacteria bacterium]
MDTGQPWFYNYREYQKKSENVKKELADWVKVSWGIFGGFLVALLLTGLLHVAAWYRALHIVAALLLAAYYLRKRALDKHLSAAWRDFWDHLSEVERNQVVELENAEYRQKSR